MIELRQQYYNLFRVRCSIAWKERDKAVIVDPGFYDGNEKAHLFALLEAEGVTPCAILLTHGHLDHIYGVKELQDKFGIPVYMSPEDRCVLAGNGASAARFGLRAPDVSFTTEDIHDGDILTFGTMRLEVISTPGHTPGGMCFYDVYDEVLFTGDTLFAGAIGRTDLEFGDYDKEIVSIMEKIMPLDGSVHIVPGHGTGSTIAYERTHNPFLQPFNEPEEEMPDDLPGIEIHA